MDHDASFAVSPNSFAISVDCCRNRRARQIPPVVALHRFAYDMPFFILTTTLQSFTASDRSRTSVADMNLKPSPVKAPANANPTRCFAQTTVLTPRNLRIRFTRVFVTQLDTLQFAFPHSSPCSRIETVHLKSFHASESNNWASDSHEL